MSDPVKNEIAVVRLRPCCPVCGEAFDPPEDGPNVALPNSIYVPLECPRGHWRGVGKFWTRQQDEVLSIG